MNQFGSALRDLKQPEQEQVVILPSTAEEHAAEMEYAIEKVFDEN